VVLYKLLQPHMSTLHALLIVAVVPGLDSVYGLLRHRRLDAFGVFFFVALLLGAATWRWAAARASSWQGNRC
jgi:hypothetical protein